MNTMSLNANADRADRGGRGVGEMLTMADKGWRGKISKVIFKAQGLPKEN